MAADAAGDTLDPATPYPTPLVGEHGYAFVVVDFLRYCLEFLGACCSLFVVVSQIYKSMGWLVAFVFFLVAAMGTTVGAFYVLARSPLDTSEVRPLSL
jgi:hypothetical protein